MLGCFKQRELLDWTTFQMNYGVVLREGVPDCPTTGVFAADEELGRLQWEDLRKRVIEHVSPLPLLHSLSVIFASSVAIKSACSLFMRSWLLGNKSFMKRVAAQLWLVAQGPAPKPRK